MAEGQDMSTERPIPENLTTPAEPIRIGGELNGVKVPKLEIQQPQSYSLTLERRLELERSGLYEQIGQSSPNKAWTPEKNKRTIKTPRIEILDDDLTQADIDRMKATPVILEDGTTVEGSVLDHYMEKVHVPKPKKEFFKIVDAWFKGMLRRKEDPSKAINTANRLLDGYDQGDNITKSNLLREMDRINYALDQEPVRVRASNRKGR